MDWMHSKKRQTICHIVSVDISLPGEEKDQVLKEGFDPAYGARQGIVGIVMFKVFCRSRFI